MLSRVRLCNSLTDCNPPDSSVHGILQERILVWSTISFSRVSSQPRYQTRISCVAGRVFTIWATGEALPLNYRKEFYGRSNGLLLYKGKELWIITDTGVKYILFLPFLSSGAPSGINLSIPKNDWDGKLVLFLIFLFWRYTVCWEFFYLLWLPQGLFVLLLNILNNCVL